MFFRLVDGSGETKDRPPRAGEYQGANGGWTRAGQATGFVVRGAVSAASLFGVRDCEQGVSVARQRGAEEAGEEVVYECVKKTAFR